MTTRLVYTVPEAAEMLNISRRSCYELVERGQIRCVRLGRNVRIPTSALEELLAQRTSGKSWASGPTADEPEPPGVSASRIVAGAKALEQFAEAFIDADPEDTTPDERRRLHEVDELLDQALERFS